MNPRTLFAAALTVALLSGCFGLPEGSADTGDLVSIRYTAEDLGSGETLRENRSASFDLGSGASGLGLEFERALRGRLPGESFDVVVRDDGSQAVGERVEVNRSLAPIAIYQDAGREEFVNFVGEPTVGLTFQAYGIYTGRVTGFDNDTVEFQIEAEDGQEDPAPTVGSMLVTHVGATTLTRVLEPIVDATFTIAPPGPFQQGTPLGLEPGSYKVLGATEDKLVLSRSTTTDADLLGKDLRVTVTLVAVTPKEVPVPTGNFGVRSSPMVKGDPDAVLGPALPADEEEVPHGH